MFNFDFLAFREKLVELGPRRRYFLLSLQLVAEIEAREVPHLLSVELKNFTDDGGDGDDGRNVFRRDGKYCKNSIKSERVHSEQSN